MSLPDYVVYRYNTLSSTIDGTVTEIGRTSDYADARRIARMHGAEIMFADHFDAAYRRV
jgi:hypothetical protein